jgi:hypothetical protein
MNSTGMSSSSKTHSQRTNDLSSDRIVVSHRRLIIAANKEAGKQDAKSAGELPAFEKPAAPRLASAALVDRLYWMVGRVKRGQGRENGRFSRASSGVKPPQKGGSLMRKQILAVLTILFIILAVVTFTAPTGAPPAAAGATAVTAPGDLIVLAWNDLGMHCYNRDFQDLAVLPPFNTLWAQVIRAGDPPQIVTSGITVDYRFPDNTTSVGKSNFWEYDQALFGVNLPPDVGLAGKGLSGLMDAASDHFLAAGIPLTEFRDSDPANPYPYQLAEITVRDASSGQVLTRTTAVAPVSTEMTCDDCHHDGGVEGIATGRVETNILTLHDEENADDYPPGHDTPLMARRPVLCAECHASNALGAPGLPGMPNLSNAIHDKHDDKMEPGMEGCYQCHPGPQTQCLRDVMSREHDMDCLDCHGDMKNVAENPQPWLQEPRCDSEGCHQDAQYAQDQPLYRLSREHGGVYCAGCHDSPHAIAPSSQANDGIKFYALQGQNGPLQTCTTCHVRTPDGPGPHGMDAPPALDWRAFLPSLLGF